MVGLHLAVLGDDDAVALAGAAVGLDGLAQLALGFGQMVLHVRGRVARVRALDRLDVIASIVQQDDVVRSAPLGEDDHRGRDDLGRGILAHERSSLESRYLPPGHFEVGH